MEDLKAGDRVQFDIEGSKLPTPHGYGRVARLLAGGVQIAPDKPLPGNTRMINICKIEAKKA